MPGVIVSGGGGIVYDDEAPVAVADEDEDDIRPSSCSWCCRNLYSIDRAFS